MADKLDKNIHPVYALNQYVWRVLELNDPNIWKKSNYGGMTPIVPISEVPEIEPFDFPHIVYGYAMERSHEVFVKKKGAVSYAIYSDNFETLTRTVTTLETALGRFDETARDINRYTDTIPYLSGLTFGYVSIAFVEGGSPETQEGGDQSAIINLNFECYIDYDVITSIV